MRSIVAPFVIVGTALMFAPAANAGEYSSAIDVCKQTISERVAGDKVKAALGDVKAKRGGNVQLDFKIRVTKGEERTRMNARCLATKGGEVLDLTLS
jgi:hypothetical protein